MDDRTYEITWERDHAFKAKDPKAKRKLCTYCNMGRNNASLVHYGAPPTLNLLGGGNIEVYKGHKKAWQEVFVRLLTEAELPRDLAAVVVEGRLCFPDKTARDEDNFRFFLAKSLGDALCEGGWLVPTRPGGHDDDCFYPVRRYSFGSIEPVYEHGVSYTKLLIFPTSKAEVDPYEGTLLEGVAHGA